MVDSPRPQAWIQSIRDLVQRPFSDTFVLYCNTGLGDNAWRGSYGDTLPINVPFLVSLSESGLAKLSLEIPRDLLSHVASRNGKDIVEFDVTWYMYDPIGDFVMCLIGC